ncbi:MAG: hypothetical protein ACOY3P_15670, partial [Planctomycetota bacterium]
ILDVYEQEGDDSVFGLMNAVTSVARDEPDPQIRWDLEELGGSIPALIPDFTKPGGAETEVFEPVLQV